MKKSFIILLFTTILALPFFAFAAPLRVLSSNPRYFTDGSGKAVYLTGSHTWSNLQDSGQVGGRMTEVMNFTDYLNFLQNHNQNFFRLWACEGWEYSSSGPANYCEPLPYQRTGSSKALDGSPKFDLNKFDQSYFGRLRSRVTSARDSGIYVSIMLFQGWSLRFGPNLAGNPWPGHPFNKDNNINGINGDPDGSNDGLESHTLQISEVTALQEGYVRKVIDTVNDLDNVLYEISNEDHSDSTDWQYHFIDFIVNYEKTKPKQHPVGMTALGIGKLDNSVLFNSPADWISPAPDSSHSYERNPMAADGRKVILLDTDHIQLGTSKDRVWVWKSFMRGYNPIAMDDLSTDSGREGVRNAMGYTLTYARKMDLKSMIPRNDLCSTEYCLANPGKEYLIYLPAQEYWGSGWFHRLGLHKLFNRATKLVGWNERAIVDLTAYSGTFRAEWFNPRSGETIDGGFTDAGTKRSFTSPFAGDAVLYIHKP